MNSRLPWLGDGRCPLFLAPMARYTDAAYRQLCKENGADVMTTEFVMCESLLRGNESAWRTLDFTEEQRPMGVQLFGSDPARMAEAAAAVEERLAPDFLDINCGCPADKVTDQHAGSSLLRDPVRLEGIVAATRKALKRVPLTVKIRIGWDEQSINALEVGRRVEAAGAEALAIHGRTKQQGYRGDADWGVIAEVARTLRIPVIGNGNLESVERAQWAMDETPVAGLMIGRGAMGYPWIFREIKHALATGETLSPPALEERWATVFRLCDLIRHFRPDRPPERGIGWMRAKLKALTTGMPGVKKLRPQMDRMQTLDELRDIADRHLNFWRAKEASVA
ncbi:MAG: tRNA dihydrouridine synthase DusB [Opitutales bacterium]